MTALAGKTCLVVGDRGALSRAVADHLQGAGAAVRDLAPAEINEPAWERAFAVGGRVDAIVTFAVPAEDGGFGRAAPEAFRRILRESYVRAFLSLRFGIPLLRDSAGGAFVTVTAAEGAGGAAARCAASAGIVLMTKSAALECAARADNVRVNAVLVGDVLSGARRLASGHVSPEDVAASIAYLLSDAAAYLTGLALPVDHGARLA
jgi:NAD(P)-dependent dehydrogenase (short-subunit alcohol dehydrogenase family)